MTWQLRKDESGAVFEAWRFGPDNPPRYPNGAPIVQLEVAVEIADDELVITGGDGDNLDDSEHIPMSVVVELMRAKGYGVTVPEPDADLVDEDPVPDGGWIRGLHDSERERSGMNFQAGHVGRPGREHGPERFSWTMAVLDAWALHHRFECPVVRERRPTDG